MVVNSAGLVLYRGAPREVWLGRMGGPFWARKDRAWSIPKGEYGADEDPLAAARREFAEEIGTAAPDAAYALLGEFRIASGKRITAYAAETDFAVDTLRSNTFELEWPPRSGRRQSFPEIDDARWFRLAEARECITSGQLPLLDALERL
ncbi:NUDIX domain-containing protein [Microbacteriaceae bacterium VKM Ac-2855]|nr:NUDIX domain-containing protein [Microbacteriaceae bacterium VKM Ac-2855]